jgi:hypothetical protein
MGIKGKLKFEEFLNTAKTDRFLDYIELLPMGRSAYLLDGLFNKYRPEAFFGENCRSELSRNWHIHVDNYFNYIPGFCAGITLGDARELPVILEKGIDLGSRPILAALVSDIRNLYQLAIDNDYRPLEQGYISKCHLCVDIRKHFIEKKIDYQELQPKEYYSHLTDD